MSAQAAHIQRQAHVWFDDLRGVFEITATGAICRMRTVAISAIQDGTTDAA